MKFDSKPIEEHREVPLADDGRWEDLVAHWQQREGSRQPVDGTHRSYLVCVALGRNVFPAAQREEMIGLSRAQGDCIVGHEVCRVVRPDARSLLRRGAARDLAERATDCGADLLVMDAQLSPSQTRNLEEATGFPVRDREAVILNVFQRHVKTRKARIQVEIAHLEYLRPRIRGLGLEMDQQAGGITGSRGPGETASELLARQLDGRLAILKKACSKIAMEGHEQRRRRSWCKKVALVGYTNAGKSSLMNSLTAAGLPAADRPFETLDTTSRCLSRHGGNVLISDTVGFIRDLPERLFASFESTLAEIQEASLLALVVDISDPEAQLHVQTTEHMLVKLGAQRIPRYYVFNKVDRLAKAPALAALQQLSQGHAHMAVCSFDVASVDRLKAELLRAARQEQVRAELVVPYDATDATALVYARSRVIEAEATEHGMRFAIEADVRVIAEINRRARGVSDDTSQQ